VLPFLRETYEPAPAAGSAVRPPLPTPWPVTVAMVNRDEQRRIGRCLDSVLAAPVDAVLVPDTGSTDLTLAVVAERTGPGCTDTQECVGRVHFSGIVTKIRSSSSV
jgi:hypothetical protein